MEEDIEILNQHLNNLYATSKDGDKTVRALRNMLIFYKTYNDMWVSTKADLLVAMCDKELRVFEKGKQINNIEKIEFKYNREGTSTIDIKKYIKGDDYQCQEKLRK